MAKNRFSTWFFAFLSLLSGSAYAQTSGVDKSHDHSKHPPSPAAQKSSDKRTSVDFPASIRQHILSNMRDHLLAVSEIQSHLGQGHFDIAAKIAEQRLGMSSLSLHGAHESAKYMPKGMQEIGTSMHRAASQFAVIAQDAEVTRDYGKVITALSKVTAACVACHAGYKVK